MRQYIPILLVLMGAALEAAADSPPSRLVVGGDAAYPPFEWIDEDGRPQGFNVELMRLLAGDEVELEFRLGTWPAAIEGLDSGTLDVLPMFASEARRARYRFSNLYAFQTHALFGRAASAPVDDPERLDGLNLVVEAGSHAESELRSRGAGPELQLSANTLEALRAVVRGEARYALLAAPVAGELIREHDLDLVRRSPPLWPLGYAFAVDGDRSELADWLQSRLVEVMANGQYLALFERWSDRIEPGERWSGSQVRGVLWIGAALVGLLLFSAVISMVLRRRVAERTREIGEELARRRQAEHHARTLARQDPVTGLANVRHFCQQAGHLLEQAADRKAAEVLLIRLVEIDTVVRAFGYPVAERTVLDFARALERTFAGPIAHLGRGTFAILDTEAVASTRLDRLEEQLRRDAGLVFPRFVAGSAFHPEDDDGVAELLQKAELALVESLQLQCRWTRYRDELQTSRMDLTLLEDARDGGLEGLNFVAQAQIDLSGRRIQAGELLARWSHPVFGDLAPDHFIPLFENAGLVPEVTRRAIDAALATLVQAGAPAEALALSVNISARDLIDPGFAQRVVALLEHHGLPGRKLKLEITETSLVRDPEAVRPGLERLAAAGVHISLDDFGTGYSSLSYISRFPISEVKIDREFVSRMLESERDLDIVRSTIHLAHELGLTVVAEGAETRRHLELLAELGCDLAQGWAVGRPEPLQSFIDRARQQPAAADRGE
jgi:EAL domain-containing protein (putative c-di-GMP-specific phosphodiesterase class I)/ABC-type amino acid transport substrate-binding protein/GGDEF domain-containing protein